MSDLSDLLDQLDAAREKATPGPWRVPYPFTKLVDVPGREAAIMSESAHDAALIVAAVNALPRLTAALRAVEALADLWDVAAELPGMDEDDTDEARNAAALIRAAIAAAVTPTEAAS